MLFLGTTDGNLVCNFGRLKIWAERGLIHVEDKSDNSYEVFSVRTALRRLDGISDMLRNSRRHLKEIGAMTNQEFDRQMRMLEQMIEVCRRAQLQGMPDDPSARRDLVRRRPTTVVVPGLKSDM